MAARRLLGQVLKDLGICHEGQIQEALMQQREAGGRIGELLIELGHLEPAQLARGLADQAGLGYEDLASSVPEPAALEKVDAGTAKAFGVLPLRIEGGVLVVAIGDPLNTSVLTDLGFTTGLEVRGVVADGKLLQDGLESHYREDESKGKEQLAALVAELQQAGSKFDLEDKAAMASAAPATPAATATPASRRRSSRSLVWSTAAAAGVAGSPALSSEGDARCDRRAAAVPSAPGRRRTRHPVPATSRTGATIRLRRRRKGRARRRVRPRTPTVARTFAEVTARGRCRTEGVCAYDAPLCTHLTATPGWR